MSIMHKVKWGDTLWDLSRKYGVSIDAIVKANKQIKDPHWIYTGDTLVIPTGSSSSSSSSGSSSSSSGKTSKHRRDFRRWKNSWPSWKPSAPASTIPSTATGFPSWWRRSSTARNFPMT